MAAPDLDAKSGALYGPKGLGDLGGPPAEQRMYSSLRGTDDTERIWRISEQLTKTTVPTT